MAKGVKKIKESETSNVLENYTSRANNIICIKPNQMVNFVISEWYEDTTPADKQRDITWLWQDQKKTTVFKSTVKLANSPFGVTIPNNLCGSYAYYLEASLFGVHDHRKTGLHVYGKCDNPDGYTNLRKEKSSTSSILEKVKTGELGEVIKQSGDWYLVKTKSGNEGYIFKTKIAPQ